MKAAYRGGCRACQNLSRERYAYEHVYQGHPPSSAEEIADPLTDVLRAGARRLLAQAVELEADAFLAGMRDLKLPDGRDRLVRHGHGPERMIQTGIGPVAVSRVKIRDRGATTAAERVRFSSSILPKLAELAEDPSGEA